MSYPQTVRRLLDQDHLFTALVELTYRCNLDCYFCYNDLSLRGKPLSLDEYTRFFEDLAALGTMNLVLSGGEPLAHPEFFALGRKARELGFVVRIKSNGHALRGATARRVRDEIDPFQIDTSLHGGTAATHDRQTRVPGSFDRLLANLEECRGLGLRIKINTTLTRWNEGEIEQIFDIADRLGCRLQVDPEVTPRDDGDTEPLAIAPSDEGLRRLYSLHARRYHAQLEKSARDLAQGDEGPSQEARNTSVEVPTIGRQDADLMKARPTAQASIATSTGEANGQALGDDSIAAQTPAPKHCGAGSTGIAVDPFGSVFPCVQWRRSIGNLHESSIAEIWNNREELADIRRLTSEVTRVLEQEGPGAARLMGYCPGLAHSLSGDPLKIYPGARRRMKTLGAALAESESNSSSKPVKLRSSRPSQLRSETEEDVRAESARALPVLS